MAQRLLFEFCIYTIAHPSKLANPHDRNGATRFSEK